MTLPKAGEFFLAANGESVYGIDWVRDGVVMMVQVPYYTDEMGLIAGEYSAAEWSEFVADWGLRPCAPRVPQRRPEQT